MDSHSEVIKQLSTGRGKNHGIFLRFTGNLANLSRFFNRPVKFTVMGRIDRMFGTPGKINKNQNMHYFPSLTDKIGHF